MAQKKPEEASVKAFRFVLGFFVYSITIAVVLAAGTFWWGAEQFKKPGPVSTSQLFTAERGQGTNAIAMELYTQELILDPFIFMIGTTILGQHTNLKAGEYEIQPGMSARDIMKLMADGKTFARRFTVPEGLTSYEIMQLLSKVENLTGEAGAIPPEGSLLPNTYDYQLDEPRTAILERMHQNLLSSISELCKVNKEENLEDWNALLQKPCGAEPLKTVRDVLTLASIVEKETAIEGERKRVAGVFLNRLKQGIALQTDPTVIYAITKGKHKNDGKGPLGRRLLSKDLEIDSPYNTYKYPGLPPGPIANPGKASIEAVLNPETNNFIYFVADGTGGHVFAKTLAEHNANVAKWRKIRREKAN